MKIAGKVFEPLSMSAVDTDAHIGRRLKEIRKLAGLSQAALAVRLNIGQAALSRMENRRDILVSSLRDYLAALGASLRVDAHFEDKAAIVSSLREADFYFEPVDENQLVLPIIGDDLFPPHRDVVFSIKPEYCNKIVDGSKTIELRRRFPMSVPAGTTALIYATSPTRALLGIAVIGQIYRQAPSDIWDAFSSQTCIRRKDFDTYFGDLACGYAIELKHARRLRRPLGLTELRNRFSFEPPQSFLYATPQMREALQYECADIPH
ncbi:helix-turn-helix domain-containing protein [Methylobacterium brachiatum]|uniref:helix-turn-helix domain-containing protein n=1 Tax=Methylobacterium brachiatum TaxID=269660 RepID=UPI000EFA75F7|nr:helix-turn-helix domain-containing protein [Methylobacterium brachiatum]AYO81764.1 helix-turn-helix domain-containing protein [Methylobacterium brachiatum]